MADVLVVLGAMAFFAICVAFVRACDRIIGPDPDQQAPAPDVSEPEAVG